MKFCWHRFNLYLLAAVAVVGLCGCKSASSSKPEPKKLLATLRLHLEASWDSSKESEPVPILRDKPVMVKVEKPPFLTEGSVSSAKVVDTIGGFALRIQFDQAGTTTLDQYTTQNRGKRVAIEQRRVAAAVAVGDRVAHERVALAQVPVQRDAHTRGRTPACGVEHVRRQASHRRSPS